KVPERWGSAGVHDGTVSEVRVADGSADLANNSAAFVDWLLKTAGVALMPGSCFGKAGEGWVRISLLKHTADLFQAAARVSRALQDK
ncbi:diaminopimelate aminotransferase, partial [Bifidobacterium bifidum]|nr:diaminopimelate aminotransferase [Bifidobacterium bifidum]